MNKVLDKFLCERFPNLYKDRHGSPIRTAMSWGFSCGDGWFQILFDLSEEVDAILKKLDADAGFSEATLATKEPRRPATEAFAVVQVKEKFGTLRYYVNGTTDEISAAVRRAENRSSVTCEDCGDPGVLRGKGWVHTSCVKCAKGALPVGCEIPERPCDKGTPGCYHDHAAELAAEQEEIRKEIAEKEEIRKEIVAEDRLRPPTAKELDPDSI